MFISKKKFKALEKRIADLEVQVQSQQVQRVTVSSNEICNAISLGCGQALSSRPFQA